MTNDPDIFDYISEAIRVTYPKLPNSDFKSIHQLVKRYILLSIRVQQSHEKGINLSFDRSEMKALRLVTNHYLATWV